MDRNYVAPKRTLAAIWRLSALLLCPSVIAPSIAATLSTAPTALPENAKALPLHIGGRAVKKAGVRGPSYWRQWPGSYFETAFVGSTAFVRVGAGEATLRVSVDDEPLGDLIRPVAGTYRISGLGAGRHVLRVDYVSESQAEPTEFGGFFAEPNANAAPLPDRSRQIEFIGDSHTVGYGNRSTTRECTPREVWDQTDATLAVPARVARHYGADYRVNAISGRGVVRNYGGAPGDTLPRAYPKALLGKAPRSPDTGWSPQLVVIALGTNDFSTPLGDKEPWASRTDLRMDFEETYARFVKMLRDRYPSATIALWIAAGTGSETEIEVGRVAARLRASGEGRLLFVPVPDLSLTGCHFHPSSADDEKIAQALEAAIEEAGGPWPEGR